MKKEIRLDPLQAIGLDFLQAELQAVTDRMNTVMADFLKTAGHPEATVLGIRGQPRPAVIIEVQEAEGVPVVAEAGHVGDTGTEEAKKEPTTAPDGG